MLRQLFFLVFWSLLFAVSPVVVAKASVTDVHATEEIHGALCVIRTDGKLVLVHEVITDRISLPGGGIEAGETFKQAAQRETWEETGLVVTVGQELGRFYNAVFYDCVSDSDVIAFSMGNAMGGNELPIWFAPHYGVETASAMLLDPSLLPASLYRYPEQWPEILSYFDSATSQSVQYVNQLRDSAPTFRQLELEWMVDLQHWVGSISDTSLIAVDHFASLIIELTTPTVLLLLFPFVMMRFDGRFVYRLFFAIATTSIMVLMAQQGFSLPRPHVYVPTVGLTQSFGYSFPSLPVALWCCVITFVFQRTGNFGFNSMTGVLVGMTVLVIASKFFLGTAFILDMLFGALLGILVAWHVLRLETNPEVNIDQLLTSKTVWSVMTVIMAVICLIWPLPVFGIWFAILMTASALMLIYDNSSVQIDTRQMIFVALVLIFAHQLYLYLVTLVSSSAFWSLGFTTLKYPLLMLLFTFVTRKLVLEKHQRAEVQEIE